MDQTYNFGYSLLDQKLLTADAVKRDLAASIVGRCQLAKEAGTPSFDVFLWLWSKTSHARDLFESHRSTVRKSALNKLAARQP